MTSRTNGHPRPSRFKWTTVVLLTIIILLVLEVCVYFDFFNSNGRVWIRSSSKTFDTRPTRPLNLSLWRFGSTTLPVNTSFVNLSTEALPGPVNKGNNKAVALFSNSSQPTWKKGSFCETFVENTFHPPVTVCGTKMLPEHSIKCFYNEKSKYMVYCTLENVLMSDPMKELIESLSLLKGEKRCPDATTSGYQKVTENGDRTRHLLDGILKRKPESTSVCGEWINKTAFFYSGDQGIHIYFRMNAYFNLHRAILREGVAPGQFVIIRHSSYPKYLFPEWEKKLFPEMITIDELPNKTICFRKVILVPYSFACILFRCKMEYNIKNPCFNCKGRGLFGNSFYSFRHRVISSCGLVDQEHHIGNRITIISRTPYKRWTKDTAEKFQRTLGNEGELVKALKNSFPHTNITVGHMEALDICTQIELAHSADVVMGVHGAGLVHLWWLQEDGLALEINPTFEEGNPTFKMLSTLTGRNYRSISASGSKHAVTVSVDRVIKELKSHTHLS